jgi:ABC-2 type transport system permease protein
MPKTLRIALREYCEAIRTKAFIIGIAIAPILMSGSILAMILLKDQVDTTAKKFAVIDRTGILAQSLVADVKERNERETFDKETGKKIKPDYIIEVVEPGADPKTQRLELSKRVKRNELAAFLEIGQDVITPKADRQTARLTYHSQNTIFDETRNWMGWRLNEHIRKLRIAEAQLNPDTINKIISGIRLENLGLVTVDKSTGKVQDARRSNEALSFGLPMGMMMLMFMMIMMGAQPLLNSALEEKTQGIAEVLLGSVRPFELMMGKLLGNLCITFTATSVYVIGGIIVAKVFDATEHIPYHILPWLVVYLIVAVFMFGAMFSAVGSACNDTKEVQSIALPTMLPLMIPMFVIVPVIKEPLSAFATGMSLFPPFTPMLMLLRQTTPAGIPAWQPILGLVGVLVFTCLCVWISGRIFRVGLLMRGKPPKFRNLLRWGLRG